MTISSLLEHAMDALSEEDFVLIGRGFGQLGVDDLEEGEDLNRLAVELLVFGEAVDADTVAKYKAGRKEGKAPAVALRHAKKASVKDAKGDERFKKVTAAHPSLSRLSKTGGKTLGKDEKMVFGRVVKLAA